MDEARETLMWNTPHKGEGPKIWCWSHKHLTRHKHPTSIQRKAIKIQNKSQDTTKSNVWVVVHPQTRGKLYLLLILLANSWADPPSSTIPYRHCRMKPPLWKVPEFMINLLLQQTWQGFSFTLWLLLLHTAERIHRDTLSPPNLTVTEAGIPSPCKQNQGKTSQAWSSLSIHASSTWGD